jgi:hypothetical protein
MLVVPTSATEPAINGSIPQCLDCVISGIRRELDEKHKRIKKRNIILGKAFSYMQSIVNRKV